MSERSNGFLGNYDFAARLALSTCGKTRGGTGSSYCLELLNLRVSTSYVTLEATNVTGCIVLVIVSMRYGRSYGLRYENLVTYGAVLTLGETRTLTGSGYCLINHLGVSERLGSSLRNENLLAYATLLTLGKTCGSTGSSYCRESSLGVRCYGNLYGSSDSVLRLCVREDEAAGALVVILYTLLGTGCSLAVNLGYNVSVVCYYFIIKAVGNTALIGVGSLCELTSKTVGNGRVGNSRVCTINIAYIRNARGAVTVSSENALRNVSLRGACAILSDANDLHLAVNVKKRGAVISNMVACGIANCNYIAGKSKVELSIGVNREAIVTSARPAAKKIGVSTARLEGDARAEFNVARCASSCVDTGKSRGRRIGEMNVTVSKYVSDKRAGVFCAYSVLGCTVCGSIVGTLCGLGNIKSTLVAVPLATYLNRVGDKLTCLNGHGTLAHVKRGLEAVLVGSVDCRILFKSYLTGHGHSTVYEYGRALLVSHNRVSTAAGNGKGAALCNVHICSAAEGDTSGCAGSIVYGNVSLLGSGTDVKGVIMVPISRVAHDSNVTDYGESVTVCRKRRESLRGLSAIGIAVLLVVGYLNLVIIEKAKLVLGIYIAVYLDCVARFYGGRILNCSALKSIGGGYHGGCGFTVNAGAGGIISKAELGESNVTVSRACEVIALAVDACATGSIEGRIYGNEITGVCNCGEAVLVGCVYKLRKRAVIAALCRNVGLDAIRIGFLSIANVKLSSNYAVHIGSVEASITDYVLILSSVIELGSYGIAVNRSGNSLKALCLENEVNAKAIVKSNARTYPRVAVYCLVTTANRDGVGSKSLLLFGEILIRKVVYIVVCVNLSCCAVVKQVYSKLLHSSVLPGSLAAAVLVIEKKQSLKITAYAEGGARTYRGSVRGIESRRERVAHILRCNTREGEYASFLRGDFGFLTAKGNYYLAAVVLYRFGIELNGDSIA